MESVGNRPDRFYNVGSPKYMSPEAFKDCKYSEQSDMWAFGVIFYQMLMGKTCDEGMTMPDYIEMVQAKGQAPIPDHLSGFSKHLLKGLLCCSLSKRFTCMLTIREIKSYQKIKKN